MEPHCEHLVMSMSSRASPCEHTRFPTISEAGTHKATVDQSVCVCVCACVCGCVRGCVCVLVGVSVFVFVFVFVGVCVAVSMCVCVCVCVSVRHTNLAMSTSS